MADLCHFATFAPSTKMHDVNYANEQLAYQTLYVCMYVCMYFYSDQHKGNVQ